MPSASSVPGLRTLVSDGTMKKKITEPLDDDLRPHYDFDYSKMNPNRFTDRKDSEKQRTVTLDDDVSEVFQNSESVNTVLRSAIKAMRSAGAKLRAPSKPQKRRAS